MNQQEIEKDNMKYYEANNELPGRLKFKVNYFKTHKGPFKYYVSMFLAFLGPPTYVSMNSTVNQPFSDPTHPLLC